MDLINKLLIKLNSSNLKITDDEKVHIDDLLKKNPELFSKIQNNVDLIMKDGKINLYDIPEIVLLIFNLYKNNISIKNVVQTVGLINVVKFILEELIQGINILPIPNVDVVIIEKMVDVSLKLLSVDVSINFN